VILDAGRQVRYEFSDSDFHFNRFVGHRLRSQLAII
jgi:hypothetical protein